MDYVVVVASIVLLVDGFFRATGTKSLPERVSGESYSKPAVRWSWVLGYFALGVLLLVQVISSRY